jgi:hypothetical protein
MSDRCVKLWLSSRCNKRGSHEGLHVAVTVPGDLIWWTQAGERITTIGPVLAEIGPLQHVGPKQLGVAPAKAQQPPKRPSYNGDICSYCQSLNVVRTGACMTCQDCGTNTGCS